MEYPSAPKTVDTRPPIRSRFKLTATQSILANAPQDVLDEIAYTAASGKIVDVDLRLLVRIRDAP